MATTHDFFQHVFQGIEATNNGVFASQIPHISPVVCHDLGAWLSLAASS